MTNCLLDSNVFLKLKHLEDTLQRIHQDEVLDIPIDAVRDIRCISPSQHPEKTNFTKDVGQARLLHDLASIELQAMELGLRTLIEFPNTPLPFKQQLTQIILEESSHLKLCLEGIESFGFKWGEWPTHQKLWQCTSKSDDLLDRILIVHRYLEGAGLDASEKILRRLHDSNFLVTKQVVKKIADDEIRHVQFGSQWFHFFCTSSGLDPNQEFQNRLRKIAHKLPKRLEKINISLRKKAGFTEQELRSLQELQKEQRDLLNI